MLRRAVAVITLRGLGVFLSLSLSADAPTTPPDVPPKSPPEDTKKTLKLAKNIEVQVLAHDPLIQKPLCINFDERGRLWMLQYIQYPIPKDLKPVEVDQYLRTRWDRVPEPPPKGPRGADKIVILEDPDENGRYRKSKEVLTGLNLATGFALGYSGIYVVQSPYLLFYRFKPGADEPAGDPEVLLTGFGMEDPHAYANSLTWGPDGWLYGAQGSTVTAHIRGVEFQQGIWRYHPVTKEFELFAEGGGNTWGIDFDRHGQLFAGGNTTEPLCHHVQGGYYIKSFGKHGALHNPYAFGYINPVKHHGFLGHGLTGGFLIYQGGLFPERFNDVAIYSNLRDNAMRVSRFEPNGSTFDTHFQEDFITTTDRWFRPVKSLVGPDGAIYVCDWYDYNISHTDPKDRSKWYMPRATGRLYRVVPEGSNPKAEGKWPLSKLTSDELVGLLRHPNEWYPREARRILMERRDATVCPRLAKMVQDEKDAKLALEALWALYVSGGLSDELAWQFLDHPIDHVRAWTVRLLGDRRRLPPRFPERLRELAQHEPSVTVRNQLACTCKRLPGPQALPIVQQLLGRAEDVADLQIPLLLWWAVEDKALSDREWVLELVGSAEAWNRPIARATIVERLARRYLGEGKPDDFAACSRLLALAPTPAERERLIKAMELQMEGQSSEKAPEALASALKPLLEQERPSSALVRLSLRLGLAGAYPLAAARTVDSQLPAEERADFVRTLGELKRPESLAPLLKLLGGEEPAPVRSATLLALQRYEAPEVATTILEQYPKLTPALRDKARDVLVSRPAWVAVLLVAVEQNRIASADFSLEQVRRVFLHKDDKLKARAEKLWGQVRVATSREKKGKIDAVARIVSKGGPGAADRGKILATKHCLSCHQLFGEGQKIGPDLTAVDRKNMDILLMNIIDPSAVIREGYQQYVVNTVDGRVLTGLFAENTPDRVTILDAKGVRTPLRQKEVDSMTRSDASLMPEGILDPLTDQELCDLFAYLRLEPGKKGK